MEIKIKVPYCKMEADTKTMKLKRVNESDYWEAKHITINDQPMTCNVIIVNCGDGEQSRLLTNEIIRRFNDFPEELKR